MGRDKNFDWYQNIYINNLGMSRKKKSIIIQKWVVSIKSLGTYVVKVVLVYVQFSFLIKTLLKYAF